MANEPTTIDVKSPAGANFAVAAFRAWIPAEAAPARGIVVLVPGSNCDGRPMVQEPAWQAFAREHRVALVGCYFTDKPHENMNIEHYGLASAGSGQALLDALDVMASRCGQPSLATVPLALWGHSAGGQFNYEMVCWRPGRVLAFVVNKGGYYFTHLAGEGARAVPGIFFAGQHDEDFRKMSLGGIFAVNRKAGARWCLAVDPGAGHEVGGTQDAAMAFFAAVIGQSGEEAGGRERFRNAWLGDLATLSIRPADALAGGGLSSWLPDEATARLWLRFVTGAPKS